MYDLLGKPYEDESPAADAVDAALPTFLGLVEAVAELPLWLACSFENGSALPAVDWAFVDAVEAVRRRLKKRLDILST